MPAVAISGRGTARLGPGQWVTDETEQDMKLKSMHVSLPSRNFASFLRHRGGAPPRALRAPLSRAVCVGAAGSGGAGVRALGQVLRAGAASSATGVLSGAARGRDLRAPPPLACGRYGVGNLQHRAASPPLRP